MWRKATAIKESSVVELTMVGEQLRLSYFTLEAGLRGLYLWGSRPSSHMVETGWGIKILMEIKVAGRKLY
jgi:hypothetical protein